MVTNARPINDSVEVILSFCRFAHLSRAGYFINLLLTKINKVCPRWLIDRVMVFVVSPIILELREQT